MHLRMLIFVFLEPTGQRYDVIIQANQASLDDTFWIEAISNFECGANPNMAVQGLLQYGKKPTVPRRPAQKISLTPCRDENMEQLHPIVKKNVPPITNSSLSKTITSTLYNSTTTGIFNWYLNHTDMKVNWSDPTLGKIYRKKTLKDTVGPFSDQGDFLNSTNLIDLPQKNQWVYINIFGDINDVEAHPIHLHGHDFYVLSQGTGEFNGVLKTQNPPRRDTALLPHRGHLVLAFKTDNPGVWLMHCHIGWHNAEGFSLQFLERKHEIKNLIDYPLLSKTCAAWDDYASRTGANEELEYDSGV